MAGAPLTEQKAFGGTRFLWRAAAAKAPVVHLRSIVVILGIVLCVTGFVGCSDNTSASKEADGRLLMAPAPRSVHDRQTRSLREFVDTLQAMTVKPQCDTSPASDTGIDPGFPDLELGMRRDDALRELACERGGYDISTFDGFFDFETYDTQLGPQYIQLTTNHGDICRKSGVARDEKCSSKPVGHGDHSARSIYGEAMELWTPGLPGEETLLGIWREHTYRDAGPSPQTIVEHLTAQFGAPSHEEIKPGTSLRLGWGKDNQERPILAQSPLSSCVMNLDPGSSHNSHWREPCGWTAGAILLLSDDSRTVERYWVAMIDQHGLIESGESMRSSIETRLASTERHNEAAQSISVAP
jgi:hypothetical protein